MEKPIHVSIKFDRDLHHKLHYVADYEGRSASGHILYLIRQNIREFEEKHGEIKKDEK